MSEIKKNKSLDAVLGYLYFFIGLNIAGFFVWACYQIAVKEIDFLVPINLQGFLCVWWAYLIATLTPAFIIKIYEMALARITDEQRKQEYLKVIQTINAQANAAKAEQELKYDDYYDDRNNRYKN